MSSVALISRLTGTSFMYHLVGDCNSKAGWGERIKGDSNNIKTYLLEGLVSNAISNENQRHDSGEEENVCTVRIAKNRPVEESLLA